MRRGRDSFRWPQPGELIIVNYDILPAWLEPQQVAGGKNRRTAVHVEQVVRDKTGDVILIVDQALGEELEDRSHQESQRPHSSCKRVWGLTGTPLENRPPDFWARCGRSEWLARYSVAGSTLWTVLRHSG